MENFSRFRNIPERLVEKWQNSANLLAKLTNVPAVLITTNQNGKTGIFISAQTENNPYHTKQIDRWLSWCTETVIKSKKKLRIPNAFETNSNNKIPDKKTGIIAYLGIPVHFPNQTPFGTICILDNKENHFDEELQQLLLLLRETIETALLQLHLTGTADETPAQTIYKEYAEIKEENRNLQKKSTQHLQQAIQQTNLVLESAQIGWWDWHIPTGREVYNEILPELLEYKLDEIEPHVSWWEQKIHPDDFSQVGKDLEEHFAGKTEYYQNEHRLQTKSGKWIWFLDYGKVVERDSNNQPLRMIGTLRVIEQQKQHEKALIEAKERAEENAKRLKISQQVAKIGYYVFDIKNDVWINTEMLDEMFGIDENYPHNVQGWLNIIHPGFRSEMLNYFQINIVTNHENFNKQYKIINQKNGSELWVQGLGKLQFDDKGEPEFMVGTIQDIAEIKHYQNELIKAKERAEESNQRFNMAMEATSDGLWDWNLLTNEIYYSPRWKSMLGYNDNELANEFAVWEKLTDDADVKKSWKMIEELISGQRNKFEVEFKMQHKAGHWIDVLSRANLFFNKEGKAYRIVGTHTDISKRKQAEKELQESEERFRKLIENMPTGVAVYKAIDNGADFLFLNVNKETEKITNSTCSELIGHTLLEKFPNMDKSPLIKSLREVLRSGKRIYIPPFYYEDSRRRGWRENNIYKLHSGEIVAIFKDVTELKEAEVELKQANEEYEAINEELRQANEELFLAKQEVEESETRFKALHNASFGGITIHDKGLILDCNKGLSEISGYSYDELIGMDGLLLIAEHKREYVMQKITSGYEKSYEAVGLRKNGEEYPLRLEARNIPYKNREVRVVEFRDISEQKKYEQDIIKAKHKAQENEAKFKSYIDNAPDAVFIANETGKYLDANEAATRITGYSKAELLAMKIPDLIYTPDLPKAGKHFQKVNKTGLARDQLRFVTKSGEIRYWSIDAVKLNNTRFLGFAKDITEQEKAKQELILAKQRAEESDRLKTEFINNMSHEIRTPMNGIMGFSDFLDIPDLPPTKRRNYINIIRSSGQQLMRIIDDILEISKLGTKQVKTIEKQVCLNDLLLEQFAIFDTKAKENKTPLYLKKELSDAASTIYTDESKLNKILSNLIENALKFTNKGFIEFGYTKKDDWLEIYVKDTGIGVSQDKQTIIFERFSQEESSMSRNAGGLGLGLAIAKENAELLGGSIRLISEKRKGSNFIVTIPYKPVNTIGTTGKAQDASDNNPDQKNTFTILVAEDEEVNFLYIETLINDHIDKECKILHAKNGKEAIEFCRENPDIDLILMDIKMPLMNGFEATKFIKAFKAGLPVIAQTAYASKDDRENALAAGCNDFITKPINIETFTKIFNKYLPV